MEEGETVVGTLKQSFLDLVDGSVDFLPKLVVALLLLLVGYVVARFVSKIIGTAVEYLETSKPVQTSLKKLGVRPIEINGVVAIFTHWAIILVFLSAAVDVLGLQVLTDTFNALVDFVPNILAASVIAGLSFVAGNALYDIVHETAHKARITASGFLAGASRVVVLIFGLPLAAAQLGLDLSIVTNNLTVVVAGVMLAFGLAFGLGGKEAASKVIDDLYKNRKK